LRHRRGEVSIRLLDVVFRRSVEQHFSRWKERRPPKAWTAMPGALDSSNPHGPVVAPLLIVPPASRLARTVA
jgi:hypothetical protein